MPSRRALSRIGAVVFVNNLLATGLLVAGMLVTAPGAAAAREPKQEPNQAAYKPETGAASVFIFNIVLHETDQNRDMPLRVGYPDARGKFPLVILSPERGAQASDYDAIADHWVSHGYVVITLTHIDAGGPDSAHVKMDSPAMEVIHSRIADAAYIITHFDAVADQMYGLKAHVDLSKLVVAGHGLGALTALAAGGIQLKNKADGAVLAMDDVHAKAVMLLGYPSTDPAMPHEPWAQLSKPALIFVASPTAKDQAKKKDHTDQERGKKDYGKRDQAAKSADSKTPPDETPGGYDVIANTEGTEAFKTYLSITDSDPTLGGLMGAGGNGESDVQGFAIVKGVSTAFLDATTKDDAAAKEFVTKADISSLTGGRAKIASKPPGDATPQSRKH